MMSKFPKQLHQCKHNMHPSLLQLSLHFNQGLLPSAPIHATCVARPAVTQPTVASIVSQPHAAPNTVDALSLRSMLQKYMHLQISTIELTLHRLHSMPPLFSRLPLPFITLLIPTKRKRRPH